MNNLEQRRKLLSALCHDSIFFSYTIWSIVIPIAILLNSEDPVVKENAKESINFHINIIIYLLVCLLLFFVIVGIPLLFMLIFASFIMPIIAVVRVVDNSDEIYRYPFIFRLV